MDALPLFCPTCRSVRLVDEGEHVRDEGWIHRIACRDCRTTLPPMNEETLPPSQRSRFKIGVLLHLKD
jgi:hypothetical protein